MIMMGPFASFISFYVISLFLFFSFEFLPGVLIIWKCIVLEAQGWCYCVVFVVCYKYMVYDDGGL